MIDIENINYYDHSSPELKDRTKSRLIEINDCEMTEIAYGKFGYGNVLSGLYIESVWSYCDSEFTDYMNRAREFISVWNNQTL